MIFKRFFVRLPYIIPSTCISKLFHFNHWSVFIHFLNGAGYQQLLPWLATQRLRESDKGATHWEPYLLFVAQYQLRRNWRLSVYFWIRICTKPTKLATTSHGKPQLLQANRPRSSCIKCYHSRSTLLLYRWFIPANMSTPSLSIRLSLELTLVISQWCLATISCIRSSTVTFSTTRSCILCRSARWRCSIFVSSPHWMPSNVVRCQSVRARWCPTVTTFQRVEISDDEDVVKTTTSRCASSSSSACSSYVRLQRCLTRFSGRYSILASASVVTSTFTTRNWVICSSLSTRRVTSSFTVCSAQHSDASSHQRCAAGGAVVHDASYPRSISNARSGERLCQRRPLDAGRQQAYDVRRHKRALWQPNQTEHHPLTNCTDFTLSVITVIPLQYNIKIIQKNMKKADFPANRTTSPKRKKPVLITRNIFNII